MMSIMVVMNLLNKGQKWLQMFLISLKIKIWVDKMEKKTNNRKNVGGKLWVRI